MTGGFLVFDIETVRNPDVSWTPPSDDPNRFPPIHAHKVVAIGGLSLTNADGLKPRYLFTCGQSDQYTEHNILTDFFETVDRGRMTLVSWNGRSFDMPVLIARAMRHGLPVPWAFGRDFRHRYTPHGHYDLCDEMAEYGGTMRPRLMHACESIGLPGKMPGVDGSKVQQLVDEMRFDVVREYVMLDVIETAILFLRWKHVKGELLESGYNKAIDTIRAMMVQQGSKETGLLINALRAIRWDVLMLPSSRPDEDDGLPF
jgi:predicted PolB exonuclease-like 3'-5' exonuclease